jgi:hypothetical protein
MEDQNIADGFIEELNEITFEVGLCYDINTIYVNQKDSKILVEFNYTKDEKDGSFVFTNVVQDLDALDEEIENAFLSSLDKDEYKDSTHIW